MFWKALQILLFTMSHGYLWGVFLLLFFCFCFSLNCRVVWVLVTRFCFFGVFWLCFFFPFSFSFSFFSFFLVWLPMKSGAPPLLRWNGLDLSKPWPFQLPSPVAECSRSYPSGTCLKPVGSTAVREAVEMFIYIVLFYRRHAYSIDVVFTVAEEFLYAVSLASRSRLKDRVK